MQQPEPFFKEIYPITSHFSEEEWLLHILKLRQHHLNPLVLQQLENCSIESKEIAQIRNELYLGRMLFLAKVAVLQNVSTHLAESAIPHVFLKGAVLSQYLFDNPYQRQSNDIDIYVPSSFVKKTIIALEEIGFKPLAEFNDAQLSFFLKYRWELSLYSAENNTVLEIHWNLSYTTLPERLNYWGQPNLKKEDVQTVNVNGFELPFLANHLLVPFQIINGCSNYWARYDIILEYHQLKSKIEVDVFEDILTKYGLNDFSEMILARYQEIKNQSFTDFSEPFKSLVMTIENQQGVHFNAIKLFWQKLLTQKEFKTYAFRIYIYPSMDDVKRFKVFPQLSVLFLLGRRFLRFTGLFKPIYSFFKPFLGRRLKKIGFKK